MQPVAADGLEVLEPVDERANGRQAVAVAGIVDRIGFVAPEHAPVLDVGGLCQADPLELALAQLDEIGIRHVPERVVLEQKYSRPRLVLLASGTMSGLQFLKFWIRPTWTSGSGRRSNCPEQVGLVHDQTHVRKSR